MTTTTIPATTTFRTADAIDAGTTQAAPGSTRSATPTQRRSFTVTGWVITGLVSAFMTFDGLLHVIQPPALLNPEDTVGVPMEAFAPIGVIALAIVALYLVPRTAMLGTVLLTAYLGGAVAAHMINQSPMFGYTLFPVYMGIVAWAGTWLRSPAVRSLMPFSRRSA